MLRRELLGRLSDPVSPPGAVAQVRGDTVGPVIVRVLRARGVLGLVCPVRVSDHAPDVPVEPCPATIRIAIEALAGVLVPSIATVSGRPRPARAAISNTCENKSVNTACASTRNRAIVA